MNEKFVLSCSGASNTGKYSDAIARKLSNKGFKMICLARLATDEKFKNITSEDIRGKELVIVDGCAFNCAKKVAESMEADSYDYYLITDYDVIKGKTEFSEWKVNNILNEIIGE